MDTTTKIQQSLIVEGKGESKTAAFSDALNKIQKQVLKGSQDVILRIEPKEVTVLSAEEQQYTERFLFFFMPRKRVDYAVKLKVEVELSTIQMNNVVFKQMDQSAPDSISFPFLSKKM
ncbi:hypothetical protein NRIC_01690 [Enterococcus florum]|uniref:Cytoplasmic protein n=1 Tax=Enterococcus florum TaxID=2480627 RepID=A0A4P5P8L2_9ENTE|nr:DUF4312 family protein [Enterococcus florum]GCF92278.1 hypothetical protein NRIC_01690 [Enterococcus florum]